MNRSSLLFLGMLVGAGALLLPPYPAGSQQADTRLALVIGNANYPSVLDPLTGAKDARDVAAALGRQGFTVFVKENLGKSEMRDAVETFAGKLGPGTIAFFYFSGYGLQTANQTYLLPVNAQIWNQSDVSREGTNLKDVLAEMHKTGAGIKVVIIDAARKKPTRGTFGNMQPDSPPWASPTAP
jgi:uncharacterized caspase-like protein